MGIINTSFRLLFFSIVLLGFFYQVLITSFGYLAFPNKASGSLISRDGEVVGSMLIAQPIQSMKYFTGRLPDVKNALDYPITDSVRISSLEYAQRQQYFKNFAETKFENSLIPIDLITASASGVDPHISKNTAYYQIESVSKARGVSSVRMKNIVDNLIESPKLLFIGEEKINVLRLNLELDRQFGDKDAGSKHNS